MHSVSTQVVADDRTILCEHINHELWLYIVADLLVQCKMELNSNIYKNCAFYAHLKTLDDTTCLPSHSSKHGCRLFGLFYYTNILMEIIIVEISITL